MKEIDNILDKIHQDEIKYSSLSFIDPVGRVFFARGRVFRAINSNLQNEILEFLNSECYRELRKNDLIVETYVTHDVELDNYSVVLEHEKIRAVRWQLLTYQQLVESYQLHIDVACVCHKYGYYLFDSGFNNIGIKDGKLLLLDFGSIRKGIDYKRETYALSFLYMTLSLMCQGYYTLARAIEPIQYTQDVPGSKILQNSEWYKQSVYPLCECYSILVRKGSHDILKFKVKNLIVFDALAKLNKAYSKIRQNEDSVLFQIQPIYKEITNLSIDDIPIRKKKVFAYDESKWLADIPRFIQQNIKPMCKCIMLYGVYDFEHIRLIREHVDGELIVAAPDVYYTDELYAFAQMHRLNILVLNYSPYTNQYLEELKNLSVDVFIADRSVLNMIWHIDSLESNYVKRISSFSRHLITTSQIETSQLLYKKLDE